MNSPTNINTTVDLASLADMVVADLAIMRRKEQFSKEGLQRGIELCSRLASRPPESQATESQARTATSQRQLHTSSVPSSAQRELQPEEIEGIRSQLQRWLDEGGDLQDEELSRIQAFVVKATAGSWQKRALDFQQRRLKRGLKQRSL
jgi:hypothetical protein